jgi:hypothetical protein
MSSILPRRPDFAAISALGGEGWAPPGSCFLARASGLVRFARGHFLFHTLLVGFTARIDLTRIFAVLLIRAAALGSTWEERPLHQPVGTPLVPSGADLTIRCPAMA